MPRAGPLRVASTVAVWFLLNIVIGNLNGWILKHHDFHYPVLLTVVHMLCCWVLSALCLLLRARPGARPVSARAVRKVRTLSVAFCASVACGNGALVITIATTQRRGDGETPLACFVDHIAVAFEQAFIGERKAAKLIVLVWINARLIEHKVGLEAVQEFGNVVSKHRHIGRIRGAIGKPNIDV